MHGKYDFVEKYIIDYDEHDDEIQRVKLDYPKPFEILLDDVFDDTIYTLYDMIGDFPRLERIKIKKGQLKNNHYFYDPFNLFTNSNERNYRSYAVSLSAIRINKAVAHDVFDKYNTVNYAAHKLATGMKNYEKRLIQDAVRQVNQNGQKLRILLFTFGNPQVVERPNINNFRNELFAFKNIGLVVYRSNESNRSYKYSPYTMEGPYY